MPEGATGQHGTEHTEAAAGGPQRRSWLLVALATVVLAGAAGFAAFAFSRHSAAGATRGGPTSSAEIRVSGIPSYVPTHVATLMGLQPVPHTQAPGFTLTDQAGKTLSLASFRGHPIVLTFMDDRCHTICPIVSREFINAEHRLAHSDPGVVFLAVNVNKHALGTATVAAFGRDNRLTAIPTWYFFTGPLATLERIWRDYGIEVATKVVNGKTTTTVEHSEIVYFIAPNGTERFLSSPNADYANTKTHRAFLPAATVQTWGKGIALVASGLSH